MSTRMKALIAIDPDATPGNIVYGIEKSISQYLRDQASGVNSFEANGGMMRKQGYQFPRTIIQGSSSGYGYALFTNFTLIESGDAYNRTLQTSIGLPLSEYHSAFTALAINDSICLSIGDWGGAKDILMRIAERISMDTYHIVDDEGNLESHFPQRLTDDPLSAITSTSNSSLSAGH